MAREIGMVVLVTLIKEITMRLMTTAKLLEDDNTGKLLENGKIGKKTIRKIQKKIETKPA
jgi:hypothetical protein